MSHAAEEIASQPECWEQAIGLAATIGATMPAAGERVVAIGCGTSLNLAKAYARLREASGAGETDAFTASEVPPARRYDRAVLFSRTGTTSETVWALERLKGRVPTVAITASPSTPLATGADGLVDTSFCDERAVIQTRFATSVLVLLRAHLGEDLTAAPDAARDALAAAIEPALLHARLHTFLGVGWCEALAEEATLKLRETAQVWAEAYQAMEYRHGPISIAEAGVAVACFGPPPAGLAEQVRSTGARWIDPDAEPLGDLVRAQRLALALADARGLDPDAPRHLARSIVLPAAS